MAILAGTRPGITAPPRRPPFFWVALAACALFAAAFSFTSRVSFRDAGVMKAPGWNVRAERTGWFVTDVDGTGPAAGRTEPGDRLVAINGDERSAVVGVSYWGNVPGETYRVDVDRRGERVSLELPPFGCLTREQEGLRVLSITADLE